MMFNLNDVRNHTELGTGYTKDAMLNLCADEITSLREQLQKAKKDGERWRYLVDNKANIVTVENEKRGYRSTMPNAVWERWSEFEGYMISTSTTNETFKTYDEAIDNAMKGNS